MGKIATTYIKEDPYKIIEEGFHVERNQVSESLFSLANEYMGIRGSFDEGSSLRNTLRGSYFNGIYEYALKDTPSAYRGVVKRTHFMINSVDWTKCSITCEGIKLDLGKCDFQNFYRELDMRTGLLTRSFVWNLDSNRKIRVCFERFLSMDECHKSFQSISFNANFDTIIQVSLSLDSSVLHWQSDCYWKGVNNIVEQDDTHILAVETISTRQKLVSAMKVTGDILKTNSKVNDREIVYEGIVKLTKNVLSKVERYVVTLVDKSNTESYKTLLEKASEEVREATKKGQKSYLLDNKIYWSEVWDRSDIIIEGSIKDQQGIRFCIFQLEQTYHAYDKTDNIGAKGLTGEAYSGHAFWDTETYCLPYYLFNNPKAGKYLLMYRYNTLNQARQRAQDLDCKGACYPIATLNGEEGCNLFQHASLQFQPSTGVAYAIFHYVNITRDIEFLKTYGIEMLVEISKFLASRGQWNQSKEYFGFYAVMGPDEFAMMVNNNTYTNYMAKKTFEYTIKVCQQFKDDQIVNQKMVKLGVNEDFLSELQNKADHMKILQLSDGLYEQHEGFFDLPHIDVDSIPQEEFPLYSHWSYDRIYRNDMIKQPDVLMFMFLYRSEFSRELEEINYDYYEPRCIHESSLSPSIHSIFAFDLNREEEALNFFSFATRLDLDDYNRNTSEGLHMTSIAAAFQNIIYGFGGLKSDGEKLVLNPKCPKIWKSYSFKLNYRSSSLKITVSQDEVVLENAGKPLSVNIFNIDYLIQDQVRIKL